MESEASDLQIIGNKIDNFPHHGQHLEKGLWTGEAMVMRESLKLEQCRLRGRWHWSDVAHALDQRLAIDTKQKGGHCQR